MECEGGRLVKKILGIFLALLLIAIPVEARRFGNMEVQGRLDVSAGETQVASGTSPPGTCTTGELFHDTNEDTDGSLMLCISTNSWKNIDDDGASGGGDVTDVFDCTTGDCNTTTVQTGEYLRVDPGGEVEASETIVHVWNDTGAILYGCTAVYISGFNVPNNLPTVGIADADDNAKMPAAGILKDDIANGAAGKIVVHGHDEGWDTTGLTVSNDVYVNDSGTSADDTCSNTLTATRPANFDDNIQKMGEVLRVHVTQGEISVGGAGRQNDVPNLQSAYFRVGNVTNVATAVQMSSEATMDNAGAVTLADSVAVISWELTTPTVKTSLTTDYLTASEIVISDGSKKIISAPVATYPSLAELAYVKGVTSAIQGQFSNILDGTTAFTDFNGAVIDSDNYVAASIDLAHMSSASVDSDNIVDATIVDADILSSSDVMSASFGITIDGGGSAITTGIKGYIEVPFAMTIDRATFLCDQSGSIVVDVWKDSYANYPPTDADTITAAAPPTITTAVKSQDTTLTGWTTSVTAEDILGFNVDSITTVERCTLIISGNKT